MTGCTAANGPCACVGMFIDQVHESYCCGKELYNNNGYMVITVIMVFIRNAIKTQWARTKYRQVGGVSLSVGTIVFSTVVTIVL